MVGVTGMTEREAEVAALEAEVAEVCGVLNAATGRLVGLIARALQTGAWEGWGICSPEHWVAWKCGVSPERARRLVAMARRLPELAATRAAFEAGELAEDQVAVVARHTPVANDAEVAELARSCTVSQLRRTLVAYPFTPPAPPPEADGVSQSPPPLDPEEARRVGLATTDDGWWRLSALLPLDEGALVERALEVARQAAFCARHPHAEAGAVPADVSWADALVAVAEASLAAPGAARPHGDRHLVVLHVDADAGERPAHLHLGPALPDALRRHLGCDARARTVVHRHGVAVSVGRTQRIVPERTRMVVEGRDRGCRVPGCGATRWLQVHHLRHWEDGGATDTANLVALCGAHHRLHHRGRLGISGDADDPHGVVFSDERGRPLPTGPRPAPPGDPPEVAARRLGLPPPRWVHPCGERLDRRWVQFSEAADTN